MQTKVSHYYKVIPGWLLFVLELQVCSRIYVVNQVQPSPVPALGQLSKGIGDPNTSVTCQQKGLCQRPLYYLGEAESQQVIRVK